MFAFNLGYILILENTENYILLQILIFVLLLLLLLLLLLILPLDLHYIAADILAHHAELTLFQELANYSQYPEDPVVDTDSKYGYVISVMRSWWCELKLVIEKSRKRQRCVIFCEVLGIHSFQ